MRNGQSNQLSFAKGMIESIKQDSLGNNLESCLVLENWDNNLEAGSVLKRAGNVTYFPTFAHRGSPKRYNGNLLSRYTNTDKNALQHSCVINTANPQINDTFIMLIDDGSTADRTLRVAAHVPYNRPGSSKNDINVDWRCSNSVANVDGINPIYQGFTIHGIYTCSCAYGESLAIGTYPLLDEDSKLDKYFPLYIWKLMDLTRKYDEGKNKYWNGISLYLNDYSNQRIFNVSTPKQMLRDSKFFGLHAYNGYSNAWDGDSPEQAGTDLSLIVIEEELRRNSYYSFDRFTYIDKAVDSSYKQPWIFPNPNVQKWYDRTVAIVKSFEVPKFPALSNIVDKIKTQMYKPLVGGSAGSPVQAFPNAKQTVLNCEDKTKLTVITLPHIGISDEAEQQLPVFEYQRFKNYSGVVNNGVVRVATFAMPDYITNNEPRCWTKGEIIPLVITANFNGHEVLVKKIDYKVKHGDNFAVPTAGEVPAHNKKGESNIALTIKKYYPSSDSAAWVMPYSHESVFSSGIGDMDLPHLNKMTNISNLKNAEFSGNYSYSSADPITAMGVEKDGTYFGSGFTHEEICPINYNAIRFTLQLSEKMFQWATVNDVTSFKVYIAKGDIGSKGMLRSVGSLSYQEPPVGLYSKPVTKAYVNDDEDFSQYGLLKEFIITGEGDIPTDYEDKEEFAISTLLRTNAWIKIGTNYRAIPIGSKDSKVNKAPAQLTDAYYLSDVNNFISSPADENEYIKYRLGYWEGFDLPTYRKHNKAEANTNIIADKRWTPDWYIHDYAFNAPTLQLNTDGKYWNGTGCEVVCVIKNRAFIATQKEQAVVRYSAAQNGVILQDLFNKEDKITIGHEVITAMVEFREQLCVFNRQAMYRVALPNIFDEATWEFLEAIDGQGTFCQKTVCKTPYGLVYGNENGVWFTDGRVPENLSAPINSLYQSLATDSPYIFGHLFSPGRVHVSSLGFNPYLEFVYDSNKDELNIITPINYPDDVELSSGKCRDIVNYDHNRGPIGQDAEFAYEYRLIYSFKSKSWRTAHYVLPFNDKPYSRGILNNTTIDPDTYTLFNSGNMGPNWLSFHHTEQHSIFGMRHFNHNGIMTTRVNYSIDSNDIHIGVFEHAREDNHYLFDMYWGWQPQLIVTRIITHEIGDGLNDFILNKTIFEGIPRERFVVLIKELGITHSLHGFKDYAHFVSPALSGLYSGMPQMQDPSIGVSLRNQAYRSQNIGQYRTIDLSTNSIQGKYSRFPNLYYGSTQTPVDDPTNAIGVDAITTIDRPTPNESITLLAPLDAKFRRMRYNICSEITSKLYGIETVMSEAKRRFQ